MTTNEAFLRTEKKRCRRQLQTNEQRLRQVGTYPEHKNSTLPALLQELTYMLGLHHEPDTELLQEQAAVLRIQTTIAHAMF